MSIMFDLILNLMHRVSSGIYFNTWYVINILTDNLSFSFHPLVWPIASIQCYVHISVYGLELRAV